uniref:Zinc finger, CCHC-type n=1 Tax=Tanacetum cinerariifolium TaxID=118510 RepID=A0A6L2J1S1_TANCI|nr:zinc finger, CCHC-type [Tanacetum cinerariifolium]
MEIPNTMINDAIKQSIGYKYYKHKKNESEKAKAAAEPEKTCLKSEVVKENGKCALGTNRWLLEKIHVTWAHLEKKQTRPQILHQSLLKKFVQCLKTAPQFLATTSGYARDGVRIPMMASESSRLKRNPRRFEEATASEFLRRHYSKPSHEGYRNTIELLDGNNVVPLRSDTIRLVQNESSFNGLCSHVFIIDGYLHVCYTDSEPWRFRWVSDEEPEAPKEAPPSPNYVPGLVHPPSPDYVPGLEHPPLPNYVPEPEYPEYLVPSDTEDPEEDPANRGDDNDESFGDDVDDEDEEASKEAFETDESAPTPPSPKLHRAWISVRPQTPMAASTEALIVARVASLSTHHTSELPSPHLLLPSTAHIDDIPEANMTLQKRNRLTAPASRFEVGESMLHAAARQTGHTLAHMFDYRYVDILDASVRASEGRVMTVIEEVSDRVLGLVTAQRQDAQEFYVRCEEHKMTEPC